MAETSDRFERYLERGGKLQTVFRSEGFQLGFLYGYLHSEERDRFHGILDQYEDGDAPGDA